MLRLLSSVAFPTASAMLRSSVTAAAAVQSTRRAVHAQAALVVRPAPAALKVRVAQSLGSQSSRGLHSVSNHSRAPCPTPVGPSLLPLRAVGSASPSAPSSLRPPSSAHLSTLTPQPRKPVDPRLVSPIKSQLHFAPPPPPPPPVVPVLRPQPRQRSTLWRWVLAVTVVWWILDDVETAWEDRNEKERMAAAWLQHWDAEKLAVPDALPEPIDLSDEERSAMDKALPVDKQDAFLSLSLAGHLWLGLLILSLQYELYHLPGAITLDELEAAMRSDEVIEPQDALPPHFWLLCFEVGAKREVETAELLIDAPANWPVTDAVRLQVVRNKLQDTAEAAIRGLYYYQQYADRLEGEEHRMWSMWAVLTECLTRLDVPQALEQACRCMQLQVEQEAKKPKADVVRSEQLRAAVDLLIHERMCRAGVIARDNEMLSAHAWANMENALANPTLAVQTDLLPSSVRSALAPPGNSGVPRFLLVAFHSKHFVSSASPETWAAALTRCFGDRAALMPTDGHWTPTSAFALARRLAIDDAEPLQLEIQWSPELASERLKKVRQMDADAVAFAMLQSSLESTEPVKAERAGHIAQQLKAAVKAMAADTNYRSVDEDLSGYQHTQFLVSA